MCDVYVVFNKRRICSILYGKVCLARMMPCVRTDAGAIWHMNDEGRIIRSCTQLYSFHVSQHCL